MRVDDAPWRPPIQMVNTDTVDAEARQMRGIMGCIFFVGHTAYKGKVDSPNAKSGAIGRGKMAFLNLNKAVSS